MDVVIHTKPDFKYKRLRLFVYSVRTKKEPNWWAYHDCEYYPEKKIFRKKESSILDFVIDDIYEATHEIPNCEDCEYKQEDDCYCETRAIMLEDRD